MLMTLLDPRPSGLRIAATTAAILMACATSTELRGEEHAASPPRAAPSDEAEKGQRGGGDRWGPQLGVIVAPSPRGSPLVLRVSSGSDAR